MQDAIASPWRVVLSLVQRFEDALAITWLFEYREAELLANGSSLDEVLDCRPSERALADLLAKCMVEREGGTWSYTDFYRPTRGNLDPTGEEVRTFLERCSDAGVRVHYADGTEIALPSPSS